MLSKLKYQGYLTVTELDTFLSEWLVLYSLPIDTPEGEYNEVDEICLKGKEKALATLLEAYKKCIKRVRKMTQTARLVELDALRVKLLSGFITYLKGCETSSDESMAAAALSYDALLGEYKGYHRLSNDAQSSIIRKFVVAVKEEKYAEAFQALQLQERTDQLEAVNEEYIALSVERDREEKNVPEPPSKLRRQCVAAYRKLVDLINLAYENNKAYDYSEKIEALSALTAKKQDLINRRRAGLATEEEENVSGEIPETETGTVA